MKDFAGHLAPFFKKTIRSDSKSLNIQKVRIFDYSSSHPSEVWVKYGSEDELWTRFGVLKKNVLTLPSAPKHASPIPIKEAKLKDVKSLVEKYVPFRFCSFYSLLMGGDASSETDESETD